MKAGNWQHDGLVEALERKVAEIDAMQKRLEENKAQLRVAIDSIKNRPAELTCSERTRWVMDRLRNPGEAPTPARAVARPPNDPAPARRAPASRSNAIRRALPTCPLLGALTLKLT